MRIKPVFILICALLIVHTEKVKSQIHDYKFKYLTADLGLSNNRVSAVLRDSRGYLWIGTENGLNRFDGMKITIYKNNELLDNSLSNNTILCIYEDHLNQLWVGTNYGLNLFNRNTETFKRYKTESTNSISGNSITNIYEDEKGNMWISTTNGFNKWDREKDTFEKFYPSEKSNIQSNIIDCIRMDANEFLWLVTRDNKLWCFDTRSLQFSNFTDSLFTSTTGLLKKLLIDNSGMIWIGTEGNGLYSFNPINKNFQQYNTNGDGKGTNGKSIKDLFLDGDRFLYIAVDLGGVNKLDIETKTFYYYVSDEKKENTLNTNAVWTVYKDNEGILYVGTSVAGLNIYNPLEDRFKTYKHIANDENSLIYNVVFKFFEDSKGLIWIGTDGGGVSVFDPKLKTFKNYEHDPNDPYSLSGNAILSICEDRNHDIWLGTWGEGLNRFDRKTEKFYHYTSNPNDPNAISNVNIINLFLDNDGNIWISYNTFELDVFNVQQGVIKKYSPNASDPAFVFNSFVHRILRQTNEKQGFATINGYFELDEVTNELKEEKRLTGYKLTDVYLDKKGNYWAATLDKGLIISTPDGKIEEHNETNGFLSNSVSGILEDNHGNMWILTASGLTKYIVQTKQFRNFTVSDGLQGTQFTRFARLKDKDGNIYIGGYNGFNVFNPDDIKVNSVIPPVYIDEFQIFNESVNINTPNSPLKQSITETKEIVLSYKQSVFSFGFSAINFTYPEKAQYAYKMEGYDEKWNYTNSSRRYATYTNLDAGEYVFKVKASNSDDIWNEIGAAIKIKILPPWWATWWFRILVLIIIAYIAIKIYERRTEGVRRDKELLEGKIREGENIIAEKVKEVEKQQEEIKKRDIEEHELRFSNEGLAKFSNILTAANDNFKDLSRQIISELVDYVSASMGVLYIYHENSDGGYLELFGSYAVDNTESDKQILKVGEGYVGTSFAEGKTITVNNLPPGYTRLTSGLGEVQPGFLYLVPAMQLTNKQGIIEIASLEELEPYKLRFIEKIGENLTSVISIRKASERLNELLEQSHQQTEELRSQEEEMRQNMEEMYATQEEMSRREEEWKKEREDLTRNQETLEEEIRALKAEIEALKTKR